MIPDEQTPMSTRDAEVPSAPAATHIVNSDHPHLPGELYDEAMLELLVLLRTGKSLESGAEEAVRERDAILAAEERISARLQARWAEMRAKQHRRQAG